MTPPRTLAAAVCAYLTIVVLFAAVFGPPGVCVVVAGAWMGVRR